MTVLCPILFFWRAIELIVTIGWTFLTALGLWFCSLFVIVIVRSRFKMWATFPGLILNLISSLCPFWLNWLSCWGYLCHWVPLIFLSFIRNNLFFSTDYLIWLRLRSEELKLRLNYWGCALTDFSLLIRIKWGSLLVNSTILLELRGGLELRGKLGVFFSLVNIFCWFWFVLRMVLKTSSGFGFFISLAGGVLCF